MNIEPVLERVRARIESERGMVATLRALPTARRMAIGAAGVALLVLAPLAIVHPPLDVGGRGLVVMLVYLLLAALLLSSVLHPTHEAESAPRTALVVLAIAVPNAVVWLGPPLVLQSAAQPQYCLALGVLGGWALVLLLHSLDRTESRTLLAVGLGSVAANLALHLHCSSTSTAHRLACHGTTGVILVLQLLAWRFVRSRA